MAIIIPSSNIYNVDSNKIKKNRIRSISYINTKFDRVEEEKSVNYQILNKSKIRSKERTEDKEKRHIGTDLGIYFYEIAYAGYLNYIYDVYQAIIPRALYNEAVENLTTDPVKLKKTFKKYSYDASFYIRMLNGDIPQNASFELTDLHLSNEEFLETVSEIQPNVSIEDQYISSDVSYSALDEGADVDNTHSEYISVEIKTVSGIKTLSYMGYNDWSPASDNLYYVGEDYANYECFGYSLEDISIDINGTVIGFEKKETSLIYPNNYSIAEMNIEGNEFIQSAEKIMSSTEIGTIVLSVDGQIEPGFNTYNYNITISANNIETITIYNAGYVTIEFASDEQGGNFYFRDFFDILNSHSLSFDVGSSCKIQGTIDGYIFYGDENDNYDFRVYFPTGWISQFGTSVVLSGNLTKYNTIYLFDNVLNEYKNGKETATVLCSISDYYDDSNNKVISSDKSTGRMCFDIYDEVIPMKMDYRGEDVPMSRNQDTTPKVFKVLATRIYYDGAVWQELTLQEV